MIANVSTQALFNANPLEFLLGDMNMNPTSTTGLQALMGPTHSSQISLRELLTGTMAGQTQTGTWNPAKQSYQYTTSNTLNPTNQNFAVLAHNFSDNIGNIVVGTALTAAGFKVARKVLRKPINMANRQLRNFGLGSTIQI